MAGKEAKVVRVNGPIILDWGNGMRLHLSLTGATAQAGAAATGRRGRKPNPATQALIEVMAQDAAAGRPRSRDAYLKVLRDHGHKGATTAGVIVAREAKRAFGHTLGREGKGKGPRGRRGGGRPLAPLSVLIREKLQEDKAGGGLRDAAHYTRWLVDNAKVGLKKARPVVYRELRAAR